MSTASSFRAHWHRPKASPCEDDIVKCNAPASEVASFMARCRLRVLVLTRPGYDPRPLGYLRAY
eukprot:1731012-Rhodomonas_salina.1